MSRWEDELDNLLANLGVQREEMQPQQENPGANFCSFHVSHTRIDVLYRMDLAGSSPELRVFVPTSEGPLKTHVFLVRFSPGSFLGHLFGLYINTQGGSPAFQAIEEITTLDLFHTMIRTMKGLFWQGDLKTLRFPSEIEVQCLTQR